MLTQKQESLLKFIEEYQLENGASPTIREMREHFNLSSDNSIVKQLKALEEKKCIRKDDTPRGIKLLDSVKERLSQPVIRIPILGMIPAGGPILTEEYIEDYVTVGVDFVSRPKDCFMLRVNGDSMFDAGIYEGDIVLADSKKNPRNGDIVVALIDNENTLKRFVTENGKTYLKPENQKYNRIYPVNELVIQGVVMALIRKY